MDSAQKPSEDEVLHRIAALKARKPVMRGKVFVQKTVLAAPVT